VSGLDLATESLSYGPVSLFHAFILALGRIEYDRRRNIPHGFGNGLDYGLWLP
jgi:hypothetical protein